MRIKVALWVVLITAGFVAFLFFSPEKKHARLRVVISSWPPWDLFRIAEERGYLEDEGLDIEFIQLTSSEDLLRAVGDGRADGAFLGLDMCARINSRGTLSKMVLVTDISHGSEGIIARRNIVGIKDLKGKKIGVTVCACSFISLAEVLNRAGLNEGDVEIVNLPEDVIVASFEAKKVDAIAVWEPNLERYASHPDAHKLIDSSAYPNLIMDGLAFSPEAIQSHRKEIRALIRIWYRMLGQLQVGDEEILKRVAELEEVERAQIEVIFQRMTLGTPEVNRTIFGSPGVPGTGLDATRRNVDLLFQYHQVSQKLDPASVWDATLEGD